MTLSGRHRHDVTDVAARPIASDASEPPGGHAEPPEEAAAIDGPTRPSARFLRAHPAHWIALGFGAGLSPVAPGTVGTLWAWLAWTVLAHWLSAAELGWLLLAALQVAWWACTVAAEHLRQPDPSAIVADEIVAFWLVLWLVLPAGFWTQLAAFALFRLLDAVKRGPVGWADRLLHGTRGWRAGLGIVLDDLVAAFCTLLVIALWRVG